MGGRGEYLKGHNLKHIEINNDTASRPVLGSTQPPIQRVPGVGGSFYGVKRPWRQGNILTSN
jgi:hypothetical protein